jgi:hypothetical protein
MNDLSFNIKISIDFFNKLLEDYNEFLSDEISSRIALNCAMTAWHLTDWIYNEFNNMFHNQFPTLPLFQQDIKRQCPSLQIMHDLANGSKHYLLTRHQPIVKETNLHEGPFSREFSREFDTTTLEMELNDGTKIYFEDEIEKVINFWRQYFQSTLQISI